MAFTTPAVAAAGIRATGQVAAAPIGRYRPTGVPRVGSKEDRAQAYRLPAAANRPFAHAYLASHPRRDAGWAAHKVLLGRLSRVWETGAELIGALHGVRLCGTVKVIAAAQDLVATAGDPG
ncbi:hypothetical protein [Streptomyces alkaliphilus]|uniref:hypothetical protein n=1 Tax=Streptomyces alkaliphilus TaxID=1472722 RepID=UPI00117CC488|nr:hypothetical protein [Streptomyces alkaliphilus]MQS06065.1 hypothetical protein [Streptomyces alkaliphilus]